VHALTGGWLLIWASFYTLPVAQSYSVKVLKG